MRSLLTVMILWLGLAASPGEERLGIEAKINGKPVRLAFDSGASHSILFRNAAVRLGLTITDPPPDSHPPPGQIAMGHTEACALTFGKTRLSSWFAVMALPAYLGENTDGVLGWEMLRGNIIQIDATAHTVHWLARLPKNALGWTIFRAPTNSSFLVLEGSSRADQLVRLLVDTGSSYGIGLRPEAWSKWKASKVHSPTTYAAYYTPAVGIVAAEESWADQLSLGQLVLSDVPVLAENPGAIPSGCQASLGLAALKRLDFIVDGKKGIAYVRAKQTPPPTYEHNRLGAAFVPGGPQDDDLVAHVADASPAFEAGIRTGDVLLNIGGLDATKWRIDPAVLPLTRFWTRPAGTKLDLTLKRGAELLTTTVVLRQILSPMKSPTDSVSAPAHSLRN
jgi:predicted aspartyl protease